MFNKKLKIPAFFKSKRFIVLAGVFLLIVILAQAGLFQADKSIEKFLYKQAQNGIQRFEKQTGLQIRWQKLDFNIFNWTVYLQGVEILPLTSVYAKDIQELTYLDGLQKINKISARPSLLSFLFKKEIFLAKVGIEEGQVALDYSKPFKKLRKRQQKNIRLPIKKLHIKNTDIAFQYKNYTLNFFDLNTKVLQKSKHTFQFDFFVPMFFIDKKEDIKHLSQHFLDPLNKKKAYELSAKGVFKPKDLSVSSLLVKNSFFESRTSALDIRFDKNRLSFFDMSSFGSFPLVLIQQLADMAGQSINFSESYLDYDLKISYDKNKKWQGNYQLSAENIFFKEAELKNIKVKGSLKGNRLWVDKGELETKTEGSVLVKKAQWQFLDKRHPYQFTVQSSALSLDLISQQILNIPQLPLSGNLTGLLSCQGLYQEESIECGFKGKSDQIRLQLADSRDEIFSAYDFNWDLALQVGSPGVNFDLKGEKQNAFLNVEGEYSFLLDELSAGYFFEGDIKKDLQFKLPFQATGRAVAKEGTVLVKDGKAYLSGQLLFSDLDLNQYFLNKLSSFYRFSDNQLIFFDIKGQLGNSFYGAKTTVDFNKNSLSVELDSDFFALQDLTQVIKKIRPLPFDLKGTGKLSVVVNYPWQKTENQRLFVLGSFFNIFINNDFFKQSGFQIDLKDQKGQLEFFLEKENQALLKAKGFFNDKYQTDINLSIVNIPLESVQFFNSLFSFNQLGDINGELKMTGFLNDPKIQGDLTISNTFLYSYAVKDTQLKLNIDKKALAFSGRIMDEIQVEEFSYQFLKKPKTKIKGSFESLDIVTFLLAKNRKDKVQNYQSKIKGFIDLEREDFWQGIVSIKDFSIAKSNKYLKSLSPFILNLDKKLWSLSSVDFVDNENQLFKVKEKKNKKLSLSGEISLDFLSLFFPFFKELEGRLEGQLLVDNNLRQLKPYGSLNLKKGLFVIPNLPDFTHVRARLNFSGNKFFIQNFKSLAGGGQLKGSGTVEYDFVRPPVLDLNLDFEKVFLQFPEGFNTNGRGDLKITGAKAPYLISGKYYIQGGSIVKEFSSSAQSMDYDFSFVNKETKQTPSIFSLNLNLKTENPIHVNNSLIQSLIEGSAYVYGPLTSILMRGKFQLFKGLKKNLIFFRGQEFNINTGSIVFSNSSPKNPYLDVSARTIFKETVRDPLVSSEEVEKEYDIFLFVKGPAEDFKFSLRSNPTLNEKEIISLLALGVNSQRFDSNVNQDVTPGLQNTGLSYSYQILTSLLIEKPLNREIKETLGVDFRLTPYINTQNKPVTKLTLSRTWFERWKTSFSRTLEETAQSDFRFKYDVSSNMSLTGFWNQEENLEELEDNWLGLDLEFNFDF